MSESDADRRWQRSAQPLGGRSNYKETWNRQAADSELAALAVAGHADEGMLDRTAAALIDSLRATVGVGSNDLVLEIGCGIGRVGKVFSAECRHWYGADISGEMLRHAAGRLKGLPRATLIELSSVGLGEFPDDSFDLVYCTIVFMHLFEWDRYRYVEEAYRVLRPGGRCFFDNIPLDSERGWGVFRESARYPLDRRPAHISMASTREELRVYLLKAGFEAVRVHDLPNGLIAATGNKPELAAAALSPGQDGESA